MCRLRVTSIVSGGQTGVDRAALDVARALEITIGGWCPKGRAAEDGPIDPAYPLRETPSARPSQRTEWNVRDSDGTLIVAPGALRGGTALTRRCAERLGKPHLVVSPTDPEAPQTIRKWCLASGITVLNVAGPRESQSPGIGAQTAAMLRRVLA